MKLSFELVNHTEETCIYSVEVENFDQIFAVKQKISDNSGK
jgi:hypothetical protein